MAKRRILRPTTWSIDVKKPTTAAEREAPTIGVGIKIEGTFQIEGSLEPLDELLCQQLTGTRRQ